MDVSKFTDQYHEMLPGVPVLVNDIMTLMFDRPVINILALDCWMEKHDGFVMDGKTSLEDHIVGKYGEKAMDFLKEHQKKTALDIFGRPEGSGCK